MNASVVRPADAALRDLGGGVSRRVLAHTDDIMIVEVDFEAGSVGAPHTHPHAQATRVLSGEFVFTVDGKMIDIAFYDGAKRTIDLAKASGVYKGDL